MVRLLGFKLALVAGLYLTAAGLLAPPGSQATEGPAALRAQPGEPRPAPSGGPWDPAPPAAGPALPAPAHPGALHNLLGGQRA